MACRSSTRRVYPSDFEYFWSIYPFDGRMDKKDTGIVWDRMSTEDRQRAVKAIPLFLKWIERQHPDYRVLHAVRYLTRRRYDDVFEWAAVEIDMVGWVEAEEFHMKQSINVGG